MNELAIFNDSYFDMHDNYDYELYSANEGLSDVGDAISGFFAKIGESIKKLSEKNDIRVSDYVKCGYSKGEAVKLVKKTASFLNQNGLVKNYIDVNAINENSVISYHKDLNSDGKKLYKAAVDTFKQCYKNKGSEIIPTYMQRARTHLDNAESKEKTVVFIINLIISIVIALFNIGAVSTAVDWIPVLGPMISGGAAVAIIIAGLFGLGLVTLIANYIIGSKYNKKRDKVMMATNYRSTESTDIFDTDHFEDVAMEADVGLKRTVAGFLGSLPALIYEAIHDSHIDQSVVVSVNAIMANGFSRDKAKKMARQTIEFFKKKGFLRYAVSPDTEVLMYNDLNDYGKQFVRGYYDAIDDIQPADMQKIIRAKQSNHKSTTGGTIFAWIHYILSAFAFGWNVGTAGLAGLIFSSVDFGISAVSLTKIESERANRKFFDNTYIDSSDVRESVDVFDEDYFI